MLSGIVTTMMLLLFIAMWIWAWQPRLRNEFAAAARLAGRTAFAAVHLAVAAHAASAPTDSADDLRRQLRQIVDGYLIDPSHERNRQ